MDETIIREYISRELVRNAELLPIDNSTPLLEAGILDSLSLLRLVMFIQDQFGIVFDDLDVVPENFASVDAICQFLRSRSDQSSRSDVGA